MHTFRRPTLVALCLLLSACGSAPSPLQPDTPEPLEAESGLGGGGGDTQPLTNALDSEVPASEAVSPSPAAPATASPVAASPTPSASVSPSGGGSSRSGGGRSNASPTPTPTPSATATPTPSATPVAAERSLVVAGDRHLVEVKTGKAFGTSPFTITGMTTEAYNNKAAGMKFSALAGATRGRYGWRYGRITAENAGEWGGDIGGPGTVFFLDSLGGEADNDGSWVINERYDDGTDVHELRTEILAKSDVCTFDPAKVAFANLGATSGTWRIQAAWENAEDAPFTFPAGCFLVFTRPDGVKDFTLVGPGETTLTAKGYVYAFFVTEAPERPDGDLRLTLTPQ